MYAFPYMKYQSSYLSKKKSFFSWPLPRTRTPQPAYFIYFFNEVFYMRYLSGEFNIPKKKQTLIKDIYRNFQKSSTTKTTITANLNYTIILFIQGVSHVCSRALQ